MTAPAIVEAVNDTYAYLHALNRGSVDCGYGRLEELIQPPANFSGLLSNVFVQAVAGRTGNAKPGLAVIGTTTAARISCLALDTTVTRCHGVRKASK